jgi:hypothetical protein
MKNVALVLVGLVVGGVAGPLLVNHVRADEQRPAVAVRWEQFCEPASSISEASSMSTARGADGWELVGFFGGALCFKRPTSDVRKASAPRGGSSSWPGY